jgi:hypothetical protein
MLSRDRLISLIDAYGGDLQRWPAAERELAERCLDNYPELLAELKNAQALDSWLSDSQTPPFAGLEARLLAQPLPPRRAGILKRVGHWLMADTFAGATQWWRPAALACIPLMLGLYVGLQLNMDSDTNTWLTTDEELYWMALGEIAEETP